MKSKITPIKLNDTYVEALLMISNLLEVNKSEAVRILIKNFLLTICPHASKKLNIEDIMRSIQDFTACFGFDKLKSAVDSKFFDDDEDY